MKLDCITVQKFWVISGQTDVGNEEIELRKKNLLSRQNILNSRQIPGDIEEKLANQVKVHRGWISRFYLSLSNKWKPCHGAINSRSRNFRAALESFFDVIKIVNKLQVEASSSMANCEIYFPIFSETMHTILKIFSQHGLRKRR